jgi:hypothetical protein
VRKVPKEKQMKQYELKDTKFLSAKSKERILKAWVRFLKSKFSYHNFTNDLYNHLHLHCQFIAHFNRKTFHGTYFEDPESTVKFLGQFDEDFDFKSVEYGTNWWHNGEYEDLNCAMIAELKILKSSIYRQLQEQIIQKKKEQLAKAQSELEAAIS